jgi:hypothetical protein
LLRNDCIRNVIDTITSKVVLILGRFTPERKALLNAMRDELRLCNYLPVLFDFEKPTNRDTVETISTLAHMARFVVADLTDARSVLQELEHIVRILPSVPVQPILQASCREPGMLDHFKSSRSFLAVRVYESTEGLLVSLKEKVITPAEAKIEELRGG